LDLSVNFKDRLFTIVKNNVSSLSRYKPLPDTCPLCHHSCSPEYFFVYHRANLETDILCGCPRNDCGALFFAGYEQDHYGNFNLRGFFPYRKKNKQFPEEIGEISPDFTEIYNQSHFAELEKLNLICGMGYRKALEFLIKDYAIKLHNDQEKQIKKMPLNSCLHKFIEDQDIKEMAERAIWLGNDETHYVKRWGSKDIQDLKNLIDLTVFYISMKLRTEKYKKEMAKN
jgi:hypothetical protein